MLFVAALVLVTLGGFTLRAWSQRPAGTFLDDHVQLWESGPWARAMILDVYGLQALLLLWMALHAWAAGIAPSTGIASAQSVKAIQLPASQAWSAIQSSSSACRP